MALTYPRGGRDPFDVIESRLNRLVRESRISQEHGAKVATKVSQDTFRRRTSARPYTFPRVGRITTRGQFPSRIEWRRYRTLGVSLVTRRLPNYWLIQEIGTNKVAQVSKGTHRVRLVEKMSVRSQVGRSIPRGLVWNTKTGSYSAPSIARRGRDQIGPIHSTKFPNRGRVAQRGSIRSGLRPITIKKEIKGKKYIRDGGRAGYEAFEQRLLAGARKAFKR